MTKGLIMRFSCAQPARMHFYGSRTIGMEIGRGKQKHRGATHGRTGERTASTRSRTAVVLALFTALAAFAMFATTAGATSTRLHPKVCGNISGPHWSWGGRSGTKYAVYAVKGAPCSVALAWAPRLFGQRPHTPDKRGADLTGPSGWGCVDASRSVPHSGYCVSATDTVFGWGPFVRRP